MTRIGDVLRAGALLLALASGHTACSSSDKSAAGRPAAAPARPAAPATPTAPGAQPTASGFHCFSWVHGDASSTDCYRSAEECEHERAGMEGRAVAACEPASHASCVHLRRPPATQELERCFGDDGACEHYRSFVQRSGHVVTACSQ
jgi:hypothetical protein